MTCAVVVIGVFAGCVGGAAVWVRLLVRDYRLTMRGERP